MISPATSRNGESLDNSSLTTLMLSDSLTSTIEFVGSTTTTTS